MCSGRDVSGGGQAAPVRKAAGGYCPAQARPRPPHLPDQVHGPVTPKPEDGEGENCAAAGAKANSAIAQSRPRRSIMFGVAIWRWGRMECGIDRRWCVLSPDRRARTSLPSSFPTQVSPACSQLRNLHLCQMMPCSPVFQAGQSAWTRAYTSNSCRRRPAAAAAAALSCLCSQTSSRSGSKRSAPRHTGMLAGAQHRRTATPRPLVVTSRQPLYQQAHGG